jgi:hypothetical protein
MQLVGQGRLHVLGELLEAGKVYRGMTKAKLAALVEGLQPQVDQLGHALSLELSDDRDYKQTLLDAHRHMAALSEQIAGEPTTELRAHATNGQLLSHAYELSGAMQDFLERAHLTHSDTANEKERASIKLAENGHAVATKRVEAFASASTFVNALVAAANRSRERREELSLLVMEPTFSIGDGTKMRLACQQARRALERACTALDPENVSLVSLSEVRTVAILANCERRAAISVAQNAIVNLGRTIAAASKGDNGQAVTVGIGVATASVVPKNFDPVRMMECAARCLSAARMNGTSAVKSIEV